MSIRNNIILCGFMGCGKSTVGKELARLLETDFIDMDEYIEKHEGMPIPEIFERYGEQDFRTREHRAVTELAGMQKTVIAAGGGALTFERNIAPLKASGRIIFLDVCFDECYSRIAETERPLVESKTRGELEALYNERRPKYLNAADLSILATGDSTEIAEESIKRLHS